MFGKRPAILLANRWSAVIRTDAVRLGAGQVQAVVDWMVDFHGELRRALDESVAGMERNDIGKVRQFFKVWLRIRDFAAASLLPDGVRELDKQQIRGVQIEAVGQQQARFLG